MERIPQGRDYRSMKIEREELPSVSSGPERLFLVVAFTLGGALLFAVLGYFAVVRFSIRRDYLTSSAVMSAGQAPDYFYPIIIASALFGAISGFFFAIHSLRESDGRDSGDGE